MNSANSTITIEDTDEDVLTLDASQDDISDPNNSQSEHSVKEISVSNTIAKDAVQISKNVDGTRENSKPLADVQTNGPKPLFKVMFRDECISRLYRKRVKDFLKELVTSKDKGQKDDNDSCNLTLEIWDSDADSISQPVDVVTESEDSQDVVCETLFMVDTQPKLKDDFDVPTYGKKYESMFETKKNAETDQESNKDAMPKLACFNCNDNHNLRDCPKPRNQNNINKNRKNFNKTGYPKNARYHLDNDQKFGHMVPGQLSDNLRKALGLKDNELPKHIYRMRMLGYPPGWLEEARLQPSGLTLFNSDGTVDCDSNDKTEKFGETNDKDLYDTKKIYDFPGYNVPPPPDTTDDHAMVWGPRVQAAHSKEAMLLTLQSKKAEDGYKRKKLKVSNTPLRDSPAPVASDMEIETMDGEGIVECLPTNGLFVPPFPLDHSEKPMQAVNDDLDWQTKETQSPGSPINRGRSPSSRTNSPSLSDLENMKKRLLVELQDSNSQPNPDTLPKSGSLNSTIKSDMPPPSTDVTPEANRVRCTKNSPNTSRGSVKSMDLGTPLLESASPYRQLPSSDKFSKDICDVINFENLPDSTGKYEQMTGVLQKVRHTLAKLQNE